MNSLIGKIVKIEGEGHLSLVEIDVEGILLKSIVIETPDTAPYLKLGNKIRVLFKETEVVVAKGPAPLISMQNQIPCKIQHLEKGKLLSRLILRFQKHTFSSIITSHALASLNLNINDQVSAMIKTNEMMLSEI